MLVKWLLNDKYQDVIALFILETPKRVLWQTDEMQHKEALLQGLHCVLRQKQSSGTEIHHFIEILIGNPL